MSEQTGFFVERVEDRILFLKRERMLPQPGLFLTVDILSVFYHTVIIRRNEAVINFCMCKDHFIRGMLRIPTLFVGTCEGDI